jgi:hypothetical protein
VLFKLAHGSAGPLDAVEKNNGVSHFGMVSRSKGKQATQVSYLKALTKPSTVTASERERYSILPSGGHSAATEFGPIMLV